MSISTVIYAQKVLNRMVEEADANGLWTGRFVALVSEIATTSHYSAVLSILRSAGAIEQIKRGGGGSPSIWQIVDASADLSMGTTNPSPLRRQQSFSDKLAVVERKMEQMMIDHLRSHHGEDAE